MNASDEKPVEYDAICGEDEEVDNVVQKAVNEAMDFDYHLTSSCIAGGKIRVLIPRWNDFHIPKLIYGSSTIDGEIETQGGQGVAPAEIEVSYVMELFSVAETGNGDLAVAYRYGIEEEAPTGAGVNQ